MFLIVHYYKPNVLKSEWLRAEMQKGQQSGIGIVLVVLNFNEAQQNIQLSLKLILI